MPSQDLRCRRPVWGCLQMLFMDTDPADHLPEIVSVCSASPYSVEELRRILFDEVLPACRFNLLDPVGEWKGFSLDGLEGRILRTHRHGWRLPALFLRRYAQRWWLRVRRGVELQRSKRDRKPPTDARRFL